MNKSFILPFILLVLTVHSASCSNKKAALEQNNPTLSASDSVIYNCLMSTLKPIDVQDSIYHHAKQSNIIYSLDTLFSNRNKWGFNGNVLIAKHGVIIYEKCFGFENYENKELLCKDSKFQLASISKQFTAIAILKLAEERRLGLKNTVEQFFPDFPYKDIAIQDLLCHRSGIPEYMDVFTSKIKPNSVASNMDLINWFITDKPKVNFKVNTQFTYCNSNYAILAAIVEQVTGQSFEAYMEQEIFKPLGMFHTHVITTSNHDITFHRTMGYTPKWSLHELDYFDGITGDKGIFTTLEDLYLWSRMLHSECLISRSTIEEAFTPRSFEKPGVKNYGYGFRMLYYQSDSSKIIFHNGWWKGYNTSFYFHPNDEYTIIVLSNKLNKSVYQNNEIIKIITGNRPGEVSEEP